MRSIAMPRPTRARSLGADIVTTEMVVFEWLETCRHPAFRSVLQLIR